MISSSENKAHIDNLLMSCRVMGRYIEDAVIEAVESILFKAGITEITAEYIPTIKNKPVITLMEKLDYTLIFGDETGGKSYLRKLTNKKPIRKILYRVEWR
jgi:predicted enzyme involved in methoxymalonyl-ACP biosynthesis